MGNASVDDFRRYVADHVSAVESTMGAALLVQGQRLAAAIDAAAPKGKSGRLESSGQANFGDVAVETTNFRSANPFQGTVTIHDSSIMKVVVTAGGRSTTKPEKHGKVAEFDYALATEFGTGHEAARPFFYPTFNRLKPSIEADLAEAFGESRLLWELGYRPGVTAGTTSGSSSK